MNKNEKLLTIIYDLLVYLDEEDSKLYDFFKNLIFEPGNSFGFKPFSEISVYIMNEIENIYKSSSFDYLYYEDIKYQTIFEKNKKNGKKYFLKKIIEEKEFKENKEKELLTLLLNTLIFIKNKELEIVSKLSSLLVLEKYKNSNSFLPKPSRKAPFFRYGDIRL